PYVVRGTERYLHELADWLVSRGHEATIVTTAPDRSRDETTDAGVRIRYRHVGRPFGRGRLEVDPVLRTLSGVARGARGVNAEVAQCHSYIDACGLRVGRIGRRLPYVWWVAGLARRANVGGRPLRRLALRTAASGAARIVTISRFAATTLLDEFGLAADVLPPGVRTELYEGPRTDGGPRIVHVGAFGLPSKRLDVLLRAFPLVLRRVPDAELVLVGHD